MHKNQSGRSMTEMLGVLAVMGILSITALLGYNYAVNKGHANRLLKDVEMAYVAATSQENCVVGKLHPIEFKATSAYPIWTECLQGDTLQTNIVIAKQVQKAVCEMVLDVAESSQWRVYSADAQTNLFAEVTSCDDDMALIFALDDITDMMFACDKECPENMMCNINDECVCAYGYEMNEATNECQEKVCDYTMGLEQQTDRYCCETVGGVWDETNSPSCSCPESYFFNGTSCVFDNVCSYIFSVPKDMAAYTSDCAYEFKVPEMTQAYKADCAYEFKVPEMTQAYKADCSYDFTVTDTNGVVTTTMKQGTRCDPGQYCILNWSNEGCTNGVSTYGNNTTTTLYGRCAPYSEYYELCVKQTDGEVSMSPVSGKTCDSGQYCILNWSDEGCTNGVGNYGNNTTTTLYGRCAPYSEYYELCVLNTEGEVSMTLNKECQTEGTYCSLQWKGQSCQSVGTYGNNTTTDLYGVCLPYDGSGETACPFE